MTAVHVSRFHFFRRFMAVLMIICFLNILAFIAGALLLHGDAVNGKRDGEHYYLHGYVPALGAKGYTEVSPAVYRYSLYHARTAVVAGALVPLLIWWYRRLGNGLREVPNNSLHSTPR
jgi:hypothetical protein